MRAQVIDNKIVAIGENIIKTKDNNVHEIDIDILPMTEEHELDYEKIFNSHVEIQNGKIIILLDEKSQLKS